MKLFDLKLLALLLAITPCAAQTSTPQYLPKSSILNTIADLKSYKGLGGITFVLGRNAPGDGGGGDFIDIGAPAVPPMMLTAVANASGGMTVYTGTITGGGSNAYVGLRFNIAGDSTAANNGGFICFGSTATTLTLQNPNGVAETHSATATSTLTEDGGVYFYDAVTGHVWHRQSTGTEIRGAWWGMVGDNATDNAQQIQAVLNFWHDNHGGQIVWPGGIFRLLSPIEIRASGVWQGMGKQGAGYFQNKGTSFAYVGSERCAFRLDPDIVNEGQYAWQALWIRDMGFDLMWPTSSPATPVSPFCAIGGSQLSNGGFEHVEFGNWNSGDLYFKIGLPTTTSPITGYISDGTGTAAGNILCVTSGDTSAGPYLLGAGIPAYTHMITGLFAPQAVFPAACTGTGGGTPILINQSLLVSPETIQIGYGSTGAYYQNVKFEDITTSNNAQLIGSDPTSGFNMRTTSIHNWNNENGQNFSAGTPDAYMDLQGVACVNIGNDTQNVIEGSTLATPNVIDIGSGGAACPNTIGHIYVETGTPASPLLHAVKVINSGYIGPSISITDLGDTSYTDSVIYFDSYVVGSNITVKDTAVYGTPTYKSADHTAYNFVTSENSGITWNKDVISRTHVVNAATAPFTNPWGNLARSLRVDTSLEQPWLDVHGQWLDGLSNGPVSIALVSGASAANEGMIDDTNEGRVFAIQSDSNSAVDLEFYLKNIPADLVGSQATISVRWRLDTSQSGYGFAPLTADSGLSNYPQDSATELAPNSPGCTSYATNAWHSSFVTFEVTSGPVIGFHTGTIYGCPAATGVQTLKIAAIKFVGGTTASYLVGGGTIGLPIAPWRCAAPPTFGTYVVGEMCKNSAPASGQPPAWENTVAGSQGTWKAWANIP